MENGTSVGGCGDDLLLLLKEVSPHSITDETTVHKGRYGGGVVLSWEPGAHLFGGKGPGAVVEQLRAVVNKKGLWEGRGC